MLSITVENVQMQAPPSPFPSPSPSPFGWGLLLPADAEEEDAEEEDAEEEDAEEGRLSAFPPPLLAIDSASETAKRRHSIALHYIPLHHIA